MKMNIIKIHYGHHSFKGMFCVSAVLLQNAFKMTSLFTDAWCLRDFPRNLPRLAVAAHQVSNKQFVAVQADRGRSLSFRVSIHCCCPTWPDLFCSISNSRNSRRKRNAGCWLSPGGALYVMNFTRLELTDMFKTKWRWNVLKSRKLVQVFEDVSSQK